jgi:hypothetical protein
MGRPWQGGTALPRSRSPHRRNNPIYLPNHSGSKIASDGNGWATSNNLFPTANPFVGPIPGQGETSFRLAASTPAIDAGFDFGASEDRVPLDFAGRCAPADGNGDSIPAWDVGAFERNAGTACLPAPEPAALFAAIAALAAVAARARTRSAR